MGRELVRAHGSVFRGIHAAGEKARVGMRPITDFEWLVTARDAENLWTAPRGILTSAETGLRYHGTPDRGVVRGAIVADWPDGTRELVAVIGDELWVDVGLGGGDATNRGWYQIADGIPGEKDVTLVQWYDQVFIFGEDLEEPLRYRHSLRQTQNPRDDVLVRLVIRKPTRAPEATVKSDGDLAAGTYTYWVTYYCSRDGWESPLSDPVTVTVQDGEQVLLYPIPQTSDPQVDRIRIYRSTANGALPLWLADIPASRSSYVDNAPDSRLGHKCETVDAITVSGRCAWKYGNRIYLGAVLEDGYLHPQRVRWCDPGRPWLWKALDFTDEIGGEIVAAVGISGGSLVLTATDAWFIRLEQSLLHVPIRTALPGVVSKHALCQIPGGAAWLSRQGVFMFSPVAGAVNVSEAIRPFIDEASTAKMENAWVAWHPRWSCLMVALPDDDKWSGQRVFVLEGLADGVTGQYFRWTWAEKATWWKIYWSGQTVYFAVPTGGTPAALGDLLVVGDYKKKFYWALSGPPNGVAKLKIGPTDFGMTHEKDFRFVSVDLSIGRTHGTSNMTSPITSTIRVDIDSADHPPVTLSYAKNVGQSWTPEGTKLGQFKLGEDRLATHAVKRLNGAPANRGRYIRLSLEPVVNQPGLEVEIHALDVTFQIAPRRT